MEKKLRKFDLVATVAAVGALLCWSLGPNVIKYLTTHLDLWTQNMLRYVVGCLFWLPFLFVSMSRKHFDKSVWRRAVIPAVANTIMQSFWASAFYFISPAFMILLGKSSLLWIAGFSLIFFAEERPLVRSKRFWLGLVLSLTGVLGVLFSGADFTATKNLIGIALALCSGFLWAVYTISAKIAFKNTDVRCGFSVVTIYTVAGLGVLAFVLGKPANCLEMGAWPWFWIVVSGVISIALSHVLYYTAIGRVGATIPSLVLLGQPFVVLAISSVVFAERLNGFQWLFGMVLIAGSALAIWAQQHLRP